MCMGCGHLKDLSVSWSVVVWKPLYMDNMMSTLYIQKATYVAIAETMSQNLGGDPKR